MIQGFDYPGGVPVCSFSKDFQEKPRRINCNSLLDQLLNDAVQRTDLEVCMSMNLDSDIVPIKCYPRALGQALRAFINQALERVRKAQADQAEPAGLLHLRTMQLSKWLALEVYDNGVKFDDDRIRALFGFQDLSSVPGADTFRASKVIERLHGGHIFYKSQTEPWVNCVRILLPVQ